VDRDFRLMISSSICDRRSSGWTDSHNYFILQHWKIPRSLQTVHWQRRWL